MGWGLGGEQDQCVAIGSSGDCAPSSEYQPHRGMWVWGSQISLPLSEAPEIHFNAEFII